MTAIGVTARVVRTGGFRPWMVWVQAPRIAGWPLATAFTEHGARRKAERMVARAQRRMGIDQ